MSTLHENIHTDFVPPWDHASWIIVDKASVLANLGSFKPVDAFLDLRPILLKRLFPLLSGEIRRRGLQGVLSDTPMVPPYGREPYDPLRVVLVPPFPCERMIEAARTDHDIVLSHCAEGMILSNFAQSIDREIRVFPRLRTPDLTADGGPTGFLPLFESLPALPKIRTAGVFLEKPFQLRVQCEAFMRSVARSMEDFRTMILIGGTEGAVPPKIPAFRIIRQEILGMSGTTNLNNALTLAGWCVPCSNEGDSVLAMVDLGANLGMGCFSGRSVHVEGERGTVVTVEESRLFIRLKERPIPPPPWKVTFLGSMNPAEGEVPEVPPEGVFTVLDRLARDFPIFLREENGTMQAPWACIVAERRLD